MPKLPQFCLSDHFPHLLVLTSGSTQEMGHIHTAAVVCSKEGSGQRNVTNIASSKFKTLRHEVDIQREISGRISRPNAFPNSAPIGCVRKREFHREVQPSDKGFVHVFTEVGRQDDYSFVLFHPLEQITRLNVGVAIM